MKLSEKVLHDIVKEHKLYKWDNRLSPEDRARLLIDIEYHMDEFIHNELEDMVIKWLVDDIPKPDTESSVNSKCLFIRDLEFINSIK